MIDFAEATKLLDLLEGHHVFQTFSDKPFKKQNLANKKDSAARSVGGTLDQAGSTLNKLQAKGAGVFIQVNDGEKRGAKNVTAIRAVFLDMDGAPLSAVTDAVKSGYPKPHCIVESSPGKYHVYWMVTGCSLERFGPVQKILAAFFGGDSCIINPDRVLRLPGSVNYKYPNEPFTVRVIHLLTKAPHLDVEDLTTFPSDVAAVPVPSYVVDDALTANLITQNSGPGNLNVLAAGDRTQKIIQIAGAIVDSNPSVTTAQVMDELKRLAMERLPEGDAPVSEASWDTEIEPGVKRFVERRNAAAQSVQEHTAEVLQEHGDGAKPFTESLSDENLNIVDFAKRFVFVSTSRVVFDLNKSPAAPPWSIAAFKDYAGVFRNNGKPLMGLWMTQRQYRRTVHNTTYVPYPPNTSGTEQQLARIVKDPINDELCYNIYAPPTLEPTDQDEKMLRKNVAPFLDHIHYLFPDAATRESFLDWWAATVQAPARRVTWAPLIISTHEGVGKGWMAQLLRIMVGASNYRMITQDQLDGGAAQFNDYLIGSTVVVIDELKARRRDDITNRLKTMITDSSIEVNQKYGAKEMVQIYANFICFSNHTDALALTDADRRYWVHILYQKPKSTGYYNRLWQWLEGDGPKNLMAFLLARDLQNFDFGKVPGATEDHNAIIQNNRTEIESLIQAALAEHEGPFAGDITYAQLVVDWLEQTTKCALERSDIADIKQWLRKHGRSLGPRRGTGTRNVLYAVRDHQTWWKAHPHLVIDSLTQSVDAVHGKQGLRVVPKDPNVST